MKLLLQLCIFFACTNLHAQYCSPSYSIGCSDGDDINSFTLTGANSTSISDLNTGCSAGAYNDRTALPLIEMIQGNNYPGTISTNYPADENAKIWIDFNDNNVFDASELLTTITAIANSAAQNYSLSIPGGAALNNHTMRVRLVFSTTTFDACNTQDYGEVHDYRVKINAIMLAITVSKINVSPQGSTNILSWSTSSEIVGDRFEVQRSASGSDFTTLTTMQATGTPGNYSFVDDKPLPGKNVYRLAFINTDGSRKFSTLVSVNNKPASNAVIMFPNPVRNTLTIQQKAPFLKAQVTVTDVNGKVLRKFFSNEATITIPFKNFSGGSYFVIYNNGVDNAVQRIQKL